MNINHLFSNLAFLGESSFGDRKEWQCGQETDKAAVYRQARQAKLSGQPAASVYIKRKIAYYDFLDEDALAAIEAQAYIAQRKEAMPDAWY